MKLGHCVYHNGQLLCCPQTILGYSETTFLDICSFFFYRHSKVFTFIQITKYNSCLNALYFEVLAVTVQNFPFSFFFFNKFIYFILFIFGCVGSSLLHVDILQLWRVGATLHCSARASHCSGFSCCGARAPGTRASVVVARGLQQLWLVGSRAEAQQLWCTGLVAPRHVGSSRTRARTVSPCIGRRILNHCATREAPKFPFFLSCC